MKPHLLLVEDDELIGSLVTANLEAEGHQVRHCTTIGSARGALEANSFDLLILDYMLPDGDGQELLRWLRNRGISRPVLMLTARGETHLKVSAFNAGADDYLTKPFSLLELTARIKALLRRARQNQPPSDSIARFAGVEVNFSRFEVAVDGEPRRLSAREMELLRFLLRHRGQVLSRDLLLEKVWHYDAEVSTRTVDTHIHNLRRKLKRPKLIKTVHGVGYKFLPPDGGEFPE